MKEYDVIVVGSGAGAIIAEYAIREGLKVALVDKGPAGGTCLNVGCIPSKMLTSVADRVMEIKEAGKFGVKAKIESVNFEKVMKDMHEAVEPEHKRILKVLKNSEDMDFYEGEGHFVEDYILEVNSKKIRGEKIFIVSGARPLIPDIKGLDKIDYLTNESLLELKKAPKSMIIIGGGYVAAEYAHFFSAMGTEITIIQRNKRLVPDEEPEISELLKEHLEKRMKIYLSTEAIEAGKNKKGYFIVGEIREKKERIKVEAESILVAAGRKSNADSLKIENSGIEINESGYVKVNDFFETSKKNIWAFGDAIGKGMFTHASRVEAGIVWHNSHHGKNENGNKLSLDFDKIPHAIFTYPEIASVGLREEEAKENYDIAVGKASYAHTAKGEALREEKNFAKIILDRNNWKVLGFHVIGPQASILIQEIINIMANGENINFIIRSMHTHPALTELVQATLSHLTTPEHVH
jgi:dihydrolipoamide dehydrogenase